MSWWPSEHRPTRRPRSVSLGFILGALVLLSAATMGCSLTGLLARQQAPTLTPTRTPRPTWTPMADAIRMATPTLDLTRFPGVTLPTAVQPTAQFLVPGSEGQLIVPTSGSGAIGVQTVVVIIVTATPIPPDTVTPSAPAGPPPPTETPGPPTETPQPTGTPLPSVMATVKTNNANVRQGPGVAYGLVTQLEKGTSITVVGRNRAGDWWKVCCVNGADVWIADSVVTAEGPIWSVAEVTDIPPPPPTPVPTATPAPTPTYAWPFRAESGVKEYPLGQNYFRVDAVIYNGTTPLWGYKLAVRRLSTGESWLSAGSEAYWRWIVVEWPDDGKLVNPSIDCPSPRTGLQCIKSNVKWDSNIVNQTMGDDIWEVSAADGAGNPISAPVRFNTSANQSKWYYVVFTSRP